MKPVSILARLLLACALLFQAHPAAALSADHRLYLPGLRTGAPLTSGDLIDAAEEEGRISAPTASLYRYLALFGGSPLPPELRGAPDPLGDVELALDLLDALPLLSPEQQAAAAPYLARPDTAASFTAGQEAAPAERAKPQGEGDRPPLNPNWVTLKSAAGQVSFHYDQTAPGMAAKAEALKTALEETIFPRQLALWGRSAAYPWIPDVWRGGDGDLDVYLIPTGLTCYGLAQPVYTQFPNSGFILLDASRPTGSATQPGMISTLAHETTHIFQLMFTYPRGRADSAWLRESVATWAEDAIFPHANEEWGYAPSYLRMRNYPIDAANPPLFRYGTYLYPFFLTRVYGQDPGLIREWFARLAEHDSLTAIGGSIPGYAEIREAWPAFARAAWNQGPVDDFRKADGFTGTPAANRAVFAALESPRSAALFAETKLYHLGAAYAHLEFPDRSARSVVFYNGVSRELKYGEGVWPGGSSYTNMDSPSEGSYAGVRITALVKIAGAWHEEDWTELPVVTFCRDLPGQRIEELVLISSNSNYDAAAQPFDYTPAGHNPVVVASPLGCYRWQGTASVVDAAWPGITDTYHAEVTLEGAFFDPSFVPYASFNVVSGTVTMTRDAYDPETHTSVHAAGTVPTGPEDTGSFVLTPNLVMDGDTMRDYSIGLMSRQSISGTATRDGYSWPVTVEIGEFFRLPSVGQDDSVTMNSLDHLAGTLQRGGVTLTWDFHLVTDP